MSNEPLSASARLSALLLRAAAAGALRRAVCSKPTDPTLKRATVAPRRIKAGEVLQLETLHTDNKAKQENLPLSDDATAQRLTAFFDTFDQINLLTSVGDCELRRSKGGKVTLLRDGALARALSADEIPSADAAQTNNRKKTYILDGSEPFLRELGVSDANGRVYDKKQAKFRQINRFLELLRDVEHHLPPRGVLHVCDLCCGKSYLSFAVYHYLTAVLGREVVMEGVDLKSDVVEHCNAVARALHFDTLQFHCGDVAAFEPRDGAHVHLVVSLHACDIATDLVLGCAMRWQSEVILSTPCCHHALNHALDCPELDSIARHSMLRQKLCDAATDALRLLLLDANGYKTEALELIDPEETPKNVMLRATRRARHMSEAEREAAMARYEDAVRFFIRTPGEAQDAFLGWGK